MDSAPTVRRFDTNVDAIAGYLAACGDVERRYGGSPVKAA